MIHLNNGDVQSVLDMQGTISALQRGYEDFEVGDATHVPRIDVYAPTDGLEDYYRFGSMIGSSRSYGVLAVRLKSDVLSWSGDSVGRSTWYCVRPGVFSGVIILYSIRNGEPLALINDGYLQHMRVGAGAGICTDVLARKDAKRVAVLGSGGMARVYLEAVSLVRSVNDVKVFSPTVANRQGFAHEMAERLGLSVQAVSSAEEAVLDADIVLSASDSLAPTFESAWLRPGMHIVTVTPREVDERTLDRADIVVQLGRGTIPSSIPIPGVTYGIGGFASYVTGQPEERARIPTSTTWERQHEFPTLYDYQPTPEAPRRRSDEQITLCLNWGTQGIQFASVAGHVYRLALGAQLGRPIPDDLFLQDIRN
jgi:alanine dehydrogenase